MAKATFGPGADRLLAPVRGFVDDALGRLPGELPLRVRIDDELEDRFYRLDEGVLSLSGLLARDGVHPCEPLCIPPLDRWRRAAGAVLEATALRELALRSGRPALGDWLWVGAAIYAADRAAPALRLIEPELALARSTADLVAHPRAGAAVMAAFDALGHDPLVRVLELLEGAVISSDEWAEIGSWVLGKRLAALLPVVVDPPAPSDLPLVLSPWTWRRLAIPPHKRGGHIASEGEVSVLAAWAKGGAVHRTMAGATGAGGRLYGTCGGPLGSWDVGSAEGFGEVMGVRGVTFDFQLTGGLQVILADAFVGPLAAVAMSPQMGSSGVATGRWRVAGRHLMRFGGIQTASLTMHGRRGQDRFLLPAGGTGIGDWIRGLEDGPWAWSIVGDRLVMRGRIMGAEVEWRARRAR
jgi:hypothetical protein